MTHATVRGGTHEVATMERLTSVPHTALNFANNSHERIGGLNVPAVAPYNEELFFIANFQTIALFDTREGIITPLEIAGASGNLAREAGFQPTGLFYDAEKNHLFVANYLRNNVMVFRVLYDTARLQLLQVLKHESLVSPEALWLDQKSGILVTANFDGHNVSAFRMHDDLSSEFVWRSALRFAHGLAVAEGKVFATGLQDRVLVELDLVTGRFLRKMGTLGWHTHEGEFLWPTSIYPDGHGNLIISDADTGFISVIDIATLSVKRVVGGNGPGRGFFNQPYFTAVSNDRFLTVSTKQQRFVYGEYPALRATKAFTKSKDFWKYFSPTDPQSRLGYTGWNDYWWTEGPRVKLLGCEYSVYSNTLRPSGPSPLVKAFLAGTERPCPDIRLGYVETPFGMNMFKQVQVMERRGWYIFLSPQSHSGPLLVKEANGRLYAFYHSEGRNDCWVVSEAIYCDNGVRNPDVMIRQVDELVASLERKRCASGVSLNKDYVETLSHWYGSIGGDKDYLARIDIPSLAREAYRSAKSMPAQGHGGENELGRFYAAWENMRTCDDVPGLVRLQAAADRTGREYFNAASITQLSMNSLVATQLPHRSGRSLVQ
ncbi:MAG: hypothetical protein NW701_15995 [Nitrospira sp.]